MASESATTTLSQLQRELTRVQKMAATAKGHTITLLCCKGLHGYHKAKEAKNEEEMTNSKGVVSGQLDSLSSNVLGLAEQDLFLPMIRAAKALALAE